MAPDGIVNKQDDAAQHKKEHIIWLLRETLQTWWKKLPHKFFILKNFLIFL